MTAAPRQTRLFAHEAPREPEPLTVLSHWAGQDSTALLLMMLFNEDKRRRWAPGRFVAACADTGDEHPATLDHICEIADLCRSHTVEYHHITPDKGFHTAVWQSLIHFYRSGNRIGSKSYPKSCTWNLKILVFYKFLEDKLASEYGVAHGKKKGLYEYVALAGQKIRVLIGVSAEEAKKRIDPGEKGPPWVVHNVERLYPLVELGMTRADCQDYIRSLGFTPPRTLPFAGVAPIRARWTSSTCTASTARASTSGSSSIGQSSTPTRSGSPTTRRRRTTALGQDPARGPRRRPRKTRAHDRRRARPPPDEPRPRGCIQVLRSTPTFLHISNHVTPLPPKGV